MPHTPGPWLINPEKAWIEIPNADAPICAMLWPTRLRDEDETRANARLIAAAPDLLDYVRRCASNCAEADALLKRVESPDV